MCPLELSLPSLLLIDVLHCTRARLRTTRDPRGAEDEQTREMCDEEPDWWGREMTLAVEASYTEEVSHLSSFHDGEASLNPVPEFRGVRVSL